MSWAWGVVFVIVGIVILAVIFYCIDKGSGL